MAALRWIGKPINEGGVTEYRFDLERETGIVPGILWSPTQQDRPVPLVMMGHGEAATSAPTGNCCWAGGLLEWRR